MPVAAAPLPSTVDAWLTYLETLHPQNIALGLERAALVNARLGSEPAFPAITVAGTNGKGSTCAILEAVLTAAGYRVGLYTSPHLLRYHERIRVAGQEVDDDALCRAFAAVEQARGDTPLTYFEFSTLAALWRFARAEVDAAVLEVGLGGRLDAVNVVAADGAVVTNIDLDHQEYLGNDRETIGAEKAGVYRSGRPAVCADLQPPRSVIAHARAVGADFIQVGQDYSYRPEADGWRYTGRRWRLNGLPPPALRGECQFGNAAAALAVLEALEARLPVTPAAIHRGLTEARLSGRFQYLAEKPAVILDVAHNPHAARVLARNLQANPVAGRTYAVFSMLRDKDIAATAAALDPWVDCWRVAEIAHPRGAAAETLERALRRGGIRGEIYRDGSIAAAWRAICDAANEDDRILAFGSFYTVAAVLRQWRESGLGGK
ncbi:MAG TPA: bifunctional tetrahydrofolate synthase/dihydrofolate synthase [Betaproteobacteria bacterium]|nr:bifunctional tetrahydrofolate synthase/dihydrofolate synthase [Betaproteobacteria bacterium]